MTLKDNWVFRSRTAAGEPPKITARWQLRSRVAPDLGPMPVTLDNLEQVAIPIDPNHRRIILLQNDAEGHALSTWLGAVDRIEYGSALSITFSFTDQLLARITREATDRWGADQPLPPSGQLRLEVTTRQSLKDSFGFANASVPHGLVDDAPRQLRSFLSIPTSFLSHTATDDGGSGDGGSGDGDPEPASPPPATATPAPAMTRDRQGRDAVWVSVVVFLAICLVVAVVIWYGRKGAAPAGPGAACERATGAAGRGGDAALRTRRPGDLV